MWNDNKTIHFLPVGYLLTLGDCSGEPYVEKGNLVFPIVKPGIVERLQMHYLDQLIYKNNLLNTPIKVDTGDKIRTNLLVDVVLVLRYHKLQMEISRDRPSNE